jgi:hypothetical protein
MATITNTRFAIDLDPLNDRASVTVSCDVEFTDVELNAINMLGLRYRLQCQIINKDLWQLKPVAILDDWTFPGATELTVSPREHVVFHTDRQMGDLSTHFLGKDHLQAELFLRNEETDEVVVSRTDFIAVDLTV